MIFGILLSVFVIFLNGFQVLDEEIIVYTAVSLFKATFVCTVIFIFVNFVCAFVHKREYYLPFLNYI